LKYTPTTCGGSELSDKYWISLHWCFLAILFRKCGCNPGVYELISVVFDGFEIFGGNLIPVFLFEPKY